MLLMQLLCRNSGTVPGIGGRYANDSALPPKASDFWLGRAGCRISIEWGERQSVHHSLKLSRRESRREGNAECLELFLRGGGGPKNPSKRPGKRSQGHTPCRRSWWAGAVRKLSVNVGYTEPKSFPMLSSNNTETDVFLRQHKPAVGQNSGRGLGIAANTLRRAGRFLNMGASLQTTTPYCAASRFAAAKKV